MYTNTTIHPDQPQPPPPPDATPDVHPFPPFPHFASIVPLQARAFAYINIIPQFQPAPPHQFQVSQFPGVEPPLQADGNPPYADTVASNHLDGEIKLLIILLKLYAVLYNTHWVAVAEVPPTQGVNQAQPAHPAAEAVAVVAYDEATATPFVQAIQVVVLVQLAPAAQPRQGQQVQVAKAVAAVHQVDPLAFPQLFPFLMIFPVPVRVRVQATYIA